jgi:Domain of unknown function (DUF222)
MSVEPIARPPLVSCADAIEAALKDVAGADPAFLKTEDKADVLLRLHALEGRMTALRLRVMAAAGELAVTTADHSVATWLAAETRTDPRAQAGDLALASALERRWSRLSEAVAEGSVNLPQARVIAAALEELPATEVGPEAIARAEEALVVYAGTYGPRELRQLGRRVLEVAAPDTCEEQEGRALEREERRAAAASGLSLRRIGDGTTRLSGRLPDPVADRLRTYLEAYAAPRRRSGVAGRDGTHRAMPRRRLGQAFAEFLENVDPRRMPLHGGDATTVLVTIDLETLRSKLPGVGLVGQEPISAAEARRLACAAQIIPVVLGGRSQVLDLGRSSRLFSPAQRKAMAVRDRCCRTEGCTIPASWCEAHHAARPWETGGRTDLADGALLCSWHHHRAHDSRYETRRLPNGDYRFHRRT